MTIKEWLNRGYNLNKEIKSLMEEKQKAFNLAVGVQAVKSGEKVQTSPSNTAEERLMNYLTFSEEIDKKIIEYQNISREIFTQISYVENPLLREILRRRYIDVDTWKGWENYSLEMNYSKRQLLRLHKRALREVENHRKKSKSDISNF